MAAIIPEPVTEKPVVGDAPLSHWNCVVGGVRMQPLPLPSVIPPLFKQYWAGVALLEEPPTRFCPSES